MKKILSVLLLPFVPFTFKSDPVSGFQIFSWDHRINGHLFVRPLIEKEFQRLFDTIMLTDGRILKIKKSGWFDYKCDYCKRDTCIYEDAYVDQIRESDNIIYSKNSL